MHSLPIFVRLEGRPVILLGNGEGADAKRRLLERAGAKIVNEDVDAALAIIAIEDETQAAQAAARLRERGILINVVDRPALCEFTLPAIVDRSPVLVAISTGGASAALAAALRQRLEALLPSGLGQLAQSLGRARRRLRERWPAPADRRVALATAMDLGAPLDPLTSAAHQAVDHWLASANDETVARVENILLSSSDPDDLTLRQARLIREAETIFHDPEIPAAILARARADARISASGSDGAVPPHGLLLHIRWSR